MKYCISTKSMFLMSLTDTKFAITLLLSVIHLVKIITYLWLINIPLFPFLGHIMDIIIAFKCEILLHTHSNFNKFFNQQNASNICLKPKLYVFNPMLWFMSMRCTNYTYRYQYIIMRWYKRNTFH